MMLIPHYVDRSAIAGAGLFTAVDIEPGTVVYRYDNRFVVLISDAEILQMPEPAQESVWKYSYRGKGKDRLSGAVYFCADDSRFMNHSGDPNIRWQENTDTYIAVRRIAAHTEIICDYGEFSEPGDYSF